MELATSFPTAAVVLADLRLAARIELETMGWVFSTH
jgi:hypothetical protein